MAIGIPICPVFPVELAKASKFEVLSFQTFLNTISKINAIIELAKKKKAGKKTTELSSFTLIVALKAIKGARI